MNCKPGDLAYVLPRTVTPGLAGRFVIVGDFCDIGCFVIDGRLYNGDVPSFLCVAADGGVLPIISGDYVKRRPIAASLLRPIRDPGDDAVDETLQRLPAPITQPKIKEDKSEVAA